MRQLASLEFGPYAPDQPDLNNPGMELASGVLPRLRGYDSLPTLTGYGTNKLPKRATGAFSAKNDAGTSFIYAGTDDKLYSLVDAGWTDVSRTTPAYSTIRRWDFTQFGNLVIAAHLDDTAQKITLGAANFSALMSDTPVQGATVASLRGFVVLGNVKDTDGHNVDRVRWGPINNPEGNWAPDIATQANFNNLRAVGGPIVKIVGGEFAMILRERSTWRMTYTGASPLFWQFDEVDPGIGCISMGSVVQHGARTFFLSEDGVRMTTGDASQAVGEEQVDLSLLRDLDQTYLERITGAVYTDEQIIVWAYPGPGNSGGQPNRLLIYNYGINRFATGDEAVDILFRASAPARSIDGFDNNPTYGGTQDPTLYASIDDIPGSLDDSVWSGGSFQLGAIDSDRDLAFYNGPPREARFETGEFQLSPDRRTFVNEMRSLVNNAENICVQIGHRASQRDEVIWSPDYKPTAEGFIPARVDNRFMRFRVVLQQGFEDAVGLNVYGEPSGGR